MTSRDDVVIRPRLDDLKASRAPSVARQYSIVDKLKHPRSLLRSLVRHRVEQQAARAAMGRTLRSGAAVAGEGEGLGVSAGFAGRSAIGSAGMILGAVAVGALIAARLSGNQSFENMGQELKHRLLGDNANEALASMEAREQLASNPHIAAAMAQGGATKDMIAAYNGIRELRLRQHKGEDAFMRDERFQVNGVLDNLLIRAREWMATGFASNGGQMVLAGLKDAFGAFLGGPAATGSIAASLGQSAGRALR